MMTLVKLLIQIGILLTFIQMTACSSTPPPTVTPVSPIISPLTAAATQISSPSPAPTATSALTLTSASTLTPLATTTPVPCPPFSIETQLPNPNVPENYIGLHFDPFAMPKGLVDFGGFLIAGPLDYGLVSVQQTDGTKMYWLERFVCRDATGKAHFEVRDVLPVPHLTRDQVMTDVCSVDGSDIPLIIAYGTYQKDQAPAPFRDTYGWTLAKVDFAWRIDIQLEKFTAVSQENLVCVKVVDWSFRPTATPAK
jgi:hypothetical protein